MHSAEIVTIALALIRKGMLQKRLEADIEVV